MTADTVNQVRTFAGASAVIAFLLIVCLLAAGLGTTHTVVDDVVDRVIVQESLAAGTAADDVLIAPATRQPQPSADDYDTRLYRADLARAKKWGS